MEMVYSTDNRFMVWHVKNILQNEGIECVVKNDMLSAAAGVLPPTECWPEVWVVKNTDVEKAKLLISDVLDVDSLHQRRLKGDDWLCLNCQEINESQFDHCWKCGEAK
ncbi:MAG: DUF2007 domain-containing protein [Gammaproteobacteria bacterium]|nr:DUF2007 domain-containing protein [Gammaproteobacteria bacterium]